MPPSPSRLHRALRLAAAGAATAVLLPATGANALPPKVSTSFTRSIEGYPSYQAQSTCQPVAQAGVLAFRDLVLRTYPGTRNLGIVRACNVGGRSEHKEGRAWDWGVRVNVAAEKARADEVIRWLLATDRYGNRHALARRLGLMYIIWNRQIWSASSGGAWRPYTGTSPHTDHVHFSFSWPGARRQTSFWTGKPLPGSNNPLPAPKPSRTTVPEPGPPGAARMPNGPDLVDETVYLEAVRRTATSRGVLRAGTTYHVEVMGTWTYGRGTADAECSTGPGAPVWARDRSVDPRRPRTDHLDLYLNGEDVVGRPLTDTGDRCDAAEHRYRFEFTPQRTLNAYLTLWDPDPAGDNRSRLTVRIWRSRELVDETVAVRARLAGGDTTRGSLVEGERYAVTATGRWSWGGGTADAECSTSAADPAWRRDRSVDPDAPEADHLDLLLGGDDMIGAAATGPRDGCDTVTSTYRAVWTAQRDGPMPLSVWDVDHSDNAGEVRVRIVRVVPLREAETVGVPGVTSAFLQRGREYTVEATGSYTWPGGTADAECSTTTDDGTWRRERTVDDRSLDLFADGESRTWSTGTSSPCDATGHRYRWTFTAPRDMQLPLRLDAPAGATGTLSVRVVPGRLTAAAQQAHSQNEPPPVVLVAAAAGHDHDHEGHGEEVPQPLDGLDPADDRRYRI